MSAEISFVNSGTVTTPAGFSAGGIYAGIKKRGTDVLDLGMLYSESPCSAAGVFTTNRIKAAPLLVTPERSPVERGVFATHSPDRPNHLGISVVRLTRIEQNVLYVRDVDMLDGTPLLDIKPYSPLGTPHPEIRQGWIDEIGGHV